MTDKTCKSGFVWEINGISEQGALSKFTVSMCIRFRVPSKKKTRGILSIKRIFSKNQMRCTIYNEQVYLIYTVSIAVWNKLSQGKSTLRPFRTLVICLRLRWFKTNTNTPTKSIHNLTEFLSFKKANLHLF